MGDVRVAVIGAGVGGLSAAIDLAARGADVTVVEAASAPGGKIRQVEIDGAFLDAGPTVFTMRWVFDEIFSDAGESLDACLTLRPTGIIARHAWSGGERLDLHADIDQAVEAIGSFAGPREAEAYRLFCDRSRRIYETLERPFIRSVRPTPIGLARNVGLGKLGDLWGIAPFTTLWRALGEHFNDPRLRQLFGRYATYCGSSPFVAPATLMLVAHVEREGVWLIEGGMHRLAAALAQLAESKGARLRYSTRAIEILVSAGRVSGLRLDNGEQIAVDGIVSNADTAALAQGLLGAAVAGSVRPTLPSERSLSAVTWNLVAPTQGFPLLRHNVFFSDDYAAEFHDIFRLRRLPVAPTIYVCAQDRDETESGTKRHERLFCLVNAPPTGNTESVTAQEVEQCEDRTFRFLNRCGLQIAPRPASTRRTTPRDFARMFPATGGALYGPSSHGWMASFRRPGSRTHLPGLYLAGGSVHPGPGVPMAALSGRMAAASLLQDFASTARSSRMVMSGGTLTG